MHEPGNRAGAAGLAFCLLFAVAACRRQENPPAAPPAPATTAPAPATTAPAPTAPAAGGAPAAPPAAGPVAGSDRAFAAEAAAGSLGEIEAGRYVAARTGDAAVKDYAQQLERDHVAANDELQRIAGGKGVSLPAAPEGDPAARLERLKSQPPAALEREFVQSFGIDVHNRAIELFERQAKEGQDPELRAYAERTLPRLREHLGMAQQLQGGKAGGA